ncbi:hypothetical protein GQ53DRAFT_815958 [Thozetella sp. PMI_491]|nr:hypothetical protein GQ53DRAFT_815958 [Thozetella sp. PMI_491]
MSLSANMTDKKCEACEVSCAFNPKSTVCAGSTILPATWASYDGPNESKEQRNKNGKASQPTNPSQGPVNNLEEAIEAVLAKRKNAGGKGSPLDGFINEQAGKFDQLGKSPVGDINRVCKDPSTVKNNVDARLGGVNKTGDGPNDDQSDEPRATPGDSRTSTGGILDVVRGFLGQTTEKSQSLVTGAAESGKDIVAGAGEMASNTLAIVGPDAPDPTLSTQKGNEEIPAGDCAQDSSCSSNNGTR